MFFFWLALFTFLICVLIDRLKVRFPRLSGRHGDLKSVQSAHSTPTPRIGGIAIFAGFGIGLLFVDMRPNAPYPGIFLATSVLFTVGLLEDLGFSVSPGRRLLAAALSSLIVVYVLGAWMPRADVPGLDSVIGHWIVGVPLTVLITSGIANGFNMIDGVNGLAAMTGLATCLALSLIATETGYDSMSLLSLMFGACLLGFLVANYPFGLIFLGDAGAYTIGFVLSWLCISILIQSPTVSPWALLLTVYWPIFDMLVAIYRRMTRERNAMRPDRLHVHQIVMRALEICFVGRHRRKISNPLTTVVLAPFVIGPPAAGVLLWNQSQAAFLAVVAFTIVNLMLYASAETMIRRFRRPLNIDQR